MSKQDNNQINCSDTNDLAILPNYHLAELTLTSSEIGHLQPPFSQKVYLEESYIQGMLSNPKRELLVKDIRAGDKLKLIREPDNQIDDSAIRVENKNGEKLGFVGMDTHTILARLMDAGKELFAQVSQVDTPTIGKHLFNEEHIVRIDIYLHD